MALGGVSAFFAIATPPCVAQTYTYVVTTIAGKAGQAGAADGTGDVARFDKPWGITADANGALYVSDFNNSTIRLIAPWGSVSTPLGWAGHSGTNDGKNTTANFNGPAGVVFDTVGNSLYVADYYNNTIRQVIFSQKTNLVGLVSTLTGSPSQAGSLDGLLSIALFNGPSGLAIDGSRNLYVADRNNHTVRKITQGGQVVTIGGVAGYVGTADGSADESLFNLPNAVAVDAANNVYVADSGNFTIRKITPNGVVSTLAGTAGVSGAKDDTGTNALFGVINGLAIDGSGNLYVADGSNTIRRVTSAGVVTTLAGTPGVSGGSDGTGSSASFNNPVGIYVASNGSGYVVDQGSDNVRMITLAETPSIITQPKGTSVVSGATVTFSVVARGDKPLVYQWLHDGVPVSAGTSSVLVLTNAQASDAGDYVVMISNIGGSVTSHAATLAVASSAPVIVSSNIVNGKQGTPMLFPIQVTGSKPYAFFIQGLPHEYVFDSTNGVISGIPLTGGRFNVSLTVTNALGMLQQNLSFNIASSIPQITSASSISGKESLAVNYQITGTDIPTNFGASGLPAGLAVDPATGKFVGAPALVGEYNSVIWARNAWGTGSANLHVSVTPVTITGLNLNMVSSNYSQPYLMNFEFRLFDNAGHSVVRPVGNFAIQAFESTSLGTVLVNNDSSGVILQPRTKIMKANLVMDYSFAMAFGFPDANTNGISDGIESMQTAAKYFIAQQPANTLFTINEFNSEDVAPANVSGGFISDNSVLNSAIDGILQKNVQGHFGGSRLFDAVQAALAGFPGAPTSNERRVMLVFTDGNDTSSSNVTDVATLAKAAASSGVQIYAIGYGSSVNTSVLGTLTQGTGGQYFLASDLKSLYVNLSTIAKDIQGVYSLRWTSLNRSTNAIEPAFTLSLPSEKQSVSFNVGNVPAFIQITNTTYTTNFVLDTNSTPVVTNAVITTNYIPATILDPNPAFPYYYVATNAGPISVGAMTFTSDPSVQPRTISLNATYVPRYVRQVRVHYRPNWPCVAQLLNTNVGEIMEGWTMTETNDGAGGRWLTASSQSTSNLLSSIPFAAQGQVFNFQFRDLQVTNQAFSLFAVDNSIYTNAPTGQSFAVTNTNAFITVYPAAPHGTPIPWMLSNAVLTAANSNSVSAIATAETTDTDLDGIPNWLEFQAGTNPNSKNSFFKVVSVDARPIFDNAQVLFSTVTNRVYRVDASTDLTNWTTMVDNVPGIGGGTNNGVMFFTDPRSKSTMPYQYYRVFAH